MRTSREHLEQQLRGLSDDELVRCATSSSLSDLARTVAMAEARARKLSLPAMDGWVQGTAGTVTGHEDLQVVARDLTSTEAHLLCSCLQAAGVPARADDTNLVQTNELWTIALGGARVRVPSAYVAEANEVIAAFRRGDFQIGEDFDVDAAP